MFILDVTFDDKTLFGSRCDGDRLYQDTNTAPQTMPGTPERLSNSITAAALPVAINGGITRT
jgi:hypothetical protein